MLLTEMQFPFFGSIFWLIVPFDASLRLGINNALEKK